MPSQHTYGCISNTFVGITLFVSMQGCGRPQSADEQEVDTHVFYCVANLNKKNAGARVSEGIINSP